MERGAAQNHDTDGCVWRVQLEGAYDGRRRWVLQNTGSVQPSRGTG